jgi:hypothetical protein
LDEPSIRFEYELVLSLKTAKVLGLDVPSTLITRDDEACPAQKFSSAAALRRSLRRWLGFSTFL